MTDPQPKRPAPPEGCASWLDCALAPGSDPSAETRYDYARAELADLRKDLAETRDRLCEAEDDLASAHDDDEEEESEVEIRSLDRIVALFNERDAALKQLSDTQGLLAQAQENALAIDAQRAEAVRERDEAQRRLAKATTRQCYIDRWQAEKERDALRAKLDEINSLGHATAKGAMDMLMNRTHQLNAARAQVAELRAAILEMGEINGHLYITYREGLRRLTVHLDHDKFSVIETHNALVAKLHAEALPGAESKEETKQ